MLIVYRATPVGSPKPRPIKDKEKLVKTCFRSFLKSFKGVKYDLVVLLDKPNESFRKFFKKHEVIESFNPDFNTGNIGTFHKQIDLVLERKPKRFFFVEDDYYFLPHAGKIIDKVDLGFFTPYDHPRYYDESIHEYPREVILSGGHHWTTVISTTLTFGGKAKLLAKEAVTMKRYGWADHDMWSNITERRKLWCPVPTLATHMETPHLAPGILVENLK
jgi:hypothetical protein